MIDFIVQIILAEPKPAKKRGIDLKKMFPEPIYLGVSGHERQPGTSPNCSCQLKSRVITGPYDW